MRFITATAAGIAVLSAAGVAMAGDTEVIVGFKGSADDSVVEKHGGQADVGLPQIRAIAAHIPASKIAALRADPAVAYVEEDGVVDAIAPGNGGGGDVSAQAQTLPWGVQRVGAPLGTGNVGTGIKVAIIDTGIDLKHADLKDNIKGGVNYVRTNSSPNDDNGHGSHVAGTVAALDNTVGVVGVAPGASLYAVKVLNAAGSGSWSGVAAGITWAGDNGMNVANMSLGGGASTTVENACTYAAGKGVLLVAAAGNSGDGNTSTNEYSYPAAYSTVVAVGATNSSDGLASFSNTGPYLEVSAPGVSIYSTYKKGAYATLSGTSMASPHAAGVAALLWYYQGASATASSVRSALGATVQDAGTAGWDAGYGNGIVYYPNHP